MTTYPVWPSRTFTRCKGHSSDLDKSSFRSNASLDADGNLRRRLLRVGEKISPVFGAELEDAPGIVCAMIVLGHDYAINPFRHPFSSHTCDAGLERTPGMAGSLAVTARPIIPEYDYLGAKYVWPVHPLRRVTIVRADENHPK